MRYFIFFSFLIALGFMACHFPSNGHVALLAEEKPGHTLVTDVGKASQAVEQTRDILAKYFTTFSPEEQRTLAVAWQRVNAIMSTIEAMAVPLDPAAVESLLVGGQRVYEGVLDVINRHQAGFSSEEWAIIENTELQIQRLLQTARAAQDVEKVKATLGLVRDLLEIATEVKL